MPEFGLGLTDVCKVSFGSDAEVGTAGHDAARLEAAVARVAPKRLAFVGKQAAKVALCSQVDYGRQRNPLAGVEAWVLPSPSGLARGFWSTGPWQELADAVAAARAAD
jgi:TDG/mug DNA glycosylase family protein